MKVAWLLTICPDRIDRGLPAGGQYSCTSQNRRSSLLQHPHTIWNLKPSALLPSPKTINHDADNPAPKIRSHSIIRLQIPEKRYEKGDRRSIQKHFLIIIQRVTFRPLVPKVVTAYSDPVVDRVSTPFWEQWTVCNLQVEYKRRFWGKSSAFMLWYLWTRLDRVLVGILNTIMLSSW